MTHSIISMIDVSSQPSESLRVFCVFDFHLDVYVLRQSFVIPALTSILLLNQLPLDIMLPAIEEPTKTLGKWCHYLM